MGTHIFKKITQFLIIIFVTFTNSAFALQVAENSQLCIQKQEEEAAKRREGEAKRLQEKLKEAQERAKRWEYFSSKEYKENVERKAEQKRKEAIQEELITFGQQPSIKGLKKQKQLKQQIDSLYIQAKDLYYKDQLDESAAVFNQILSLDQTQTTAKDYIEKRLPQRKAQIEAHNQKLAEEKSRLEELKKKQELERARLEQEKKLAEERRLQEELKRQEELEAQRLEEQQRKAQLAKQRELKQQIDSLYVQAKDLYYKDQLDESAAVFNQILSLDQTQTTAKDYIDKRIPQCKARIEALDEKRRQDEQKRQDELKEQQEQEAQRIEELKRQQELERARLEELKKKQELERARLEEGRKLKIKSKSKVLTRSTETVNEEIKKETGVKKIGKLLNAEEGEEYRVRPFDILMIKIYQEADLSGDYRVQKGGFIDMPLIRKVQVENFTVYEIEDKITSLFSKDYLMNPQIMITVKEYHAEKIIILGQVVKPGTYAISAEEPVTLLRAISMASGFTNIAAVNNVRIIRMEKNKKVTRVVRAAEIIDGKKEDVPLEPGDIVVVPESFW